MTAILNYTAVTEMTTDALRRAFIAARDIADSPGTVRAHRLARERMSIARDELARRGEVPNPIVRTTPLRAYPTWSVREYFDGHFDAAANAGLGLSWGCASFAEAVAAVKEMTTR